jgi:hypothetical protein
MEPVPSATTSFTWAKFLKKCNEHVRTLNMCSISLEKKLCSPMFSRSVR